MAAPIQKPQIPARRGPIPVSEQARNQARAGMSGEQVKTAVEAPAAPVEVPVAPVPLPPAPAAVAVPEVLAPAPAPETPETGVGATPPEVLNAVTGNPVSEPVAEPVPTATAPRSATPVTPVAGARRGRKPAPPNAVLMEPEHSVKIPETVWNEIRLALVLLPKGEDSPANIKAYLVAAHRTYEAQLRKQGKLPAVK